MSESLILFLLFYSAFALGIARVVQKSIASKVDPKTYAFFVCLSSLVFSGFILLFKSDETMSISLSHIPFIIFAGGLWYFANLVGIKSMTLADITLREPILQTRNIFVLLLGVFLLGEVVSINEVLGICIIVVGGLFATYTKNLTIKSAKLDGTFLCLMSSFLTGAGYVIDKHNLNFVDPLFYSTLMFAIPLSIMIKDIKKYMRIFLNLNLNVKVTIVLNNWLATSGLLAFAYGLKYTDVSVAYPIMSLSFVFVFIGGYFILGERTNFNNRLIGGVIALVGAVVMRVFG